MTKEEHINWEVFLGDLKFQAMRKALNDPECKAEIKPIQDEIKAKINELNNKETEIINRYKKKYYDQLCAEHDNQVMLISAALERIKAEQAR